MNTSSSSGSKSISSRCTKSGWSAVASSSSRCRIASMRPARRARRRPPGSRHRAPQQLEVTARDRHRRAQLVRGVVQEALLALEQRPLLLGALLGDLRASARRRACHDHARNMRRHQTDLDSSPQTGAAEGVERRARIRSAPITQRRARAASTQRPDPERRTASTRLIQTKWKRIVSQLGHDDHRRVVGDREHDHAHSTQQVSGADRLRRSCRGAVTGVADGLDRRVGSELSPQPAHADIDDVGARIEVRAPDLRQEPLAADRPRRRAASGSAAGGTRGRRGQRRLTDAGLAAGDVERERPARRSCCRRRRARAELRPGPGEQFVERERLRQAVDGAELEAAQLRRQIVAGRRINTDSSGPRRVARSTSRPSRPGSSRSRMTIS